MSLHCQTSYIETDIVAFLHFHAALPVKRMVRPRTATAWTPPEG
jgi:hypothetical protein